MSIPTKNYGPEFLAALAADIPAPEGGPLTDLVQRLRGGGWDLRSPQELADMIADQIERALAAPAPQAADHSPDAGKKVGGDQAPAEGDDLDRDEAIRVWRRHCDKFSDALKKEPPSPVIDAMLEFARAHVQPKGTKLAGSTDSRVGTTGWARDLA